MLAALLAGGIAGSSGGTSTAPAAAAAAAPASPAAPKVASAAPAGRFEFRSLGDAGEAARYAVWTPPGFDSTKVWPCIVFLHGSGECGDDGVKPTRVGIGPALTANPERWPAVVVFPQKPREEEEWEEHEDRVLAVLAAVKKELRIDPARIALTGNSQGGHGAWYVGARHRDLWSCLVPVCGYGRARTVAPRIDGLPVWAFHGLLDDLVNPEDTRQIVGELRARRARGASAGAGAAEVRMTLYPGVNHGSWEAAYAEPELAGWILNQRRVGGTP
jgi:predicted peptidase